ncbi:MAG: peptide-methionine (R)-S-oxide reductase [Euryarchaeota archaeon]|jgi:peptide-methionine (R)-S-oxide reductase|nr:peptide-methionine (R)-S-oxide reductase [Euryarchaeota archaeon]
MSDRLPLFIPERDAEWRSRLTPLQYHVTREAGTERPNTGLLNMEESEGSYYCVCCGHILFTAEMKYNSGCGWPAFHAEHSAAGIRRLTDRSLGRVRVEVRCGSCDSHLGHVFEDGPIEFGGERYCINSASMDFIPEEDA